MCRILTSLNAVAETCAAEGEMLWEKALDGSDSYALCYAPSVRAGALGPSSGHLQCDRGSYFMVEAPKFCCRHPRIQVAGQSVPARGEVCGDLLAQYDAEQQQIKLARGPTTTGSDEQLADLNASATGDATPSQIAFHAMGDAGKWRPSAITTCSGKAGALITWLNGDTPNRAEFCPTGTTPVQGPGYASWQCDGMYSEDSLLHCCKVKGRLRCVNHIREQAPGSQCNCKGLGVNEESSADTVTSCAWPAFVALQLGGDLFAGWPTDLRGSL
eukprot:CAMPEP_0172718834 /NCGR_PEP_ID=MMETSP1074-20121228/75153_1 /TAXON_ID=2916 /ORGANISM="Ceratium fusus, Strain PA161109" /LENGTH=271 /DNA_ID=CAMNT_0013544109 /DNA_START=73 /DNA_END=885 /DNA_ORIENTATION=+